MPRKGNVNNLDFLNKVGRESKTSLKEVSDLQAGTFDEIVSDPNKKLAYIDIDLMDDAPLEWNYYPRLKDTQPDKYLELKYSIYDHGIEQPLMLWKQENGRYMIVAGHNRREICREIIKECSEEPNFDQEKYKFLPAIIKDFDELAEQQVKDIIDDTNCAMRDFSKMPEEVKVRIMQRRMDVFKRRRYSKGERIDQMAKEFGLKKSSIYNTMTIVDEIIQPFQELFYNGCLTKKAVLRFAYYDKGLQEWIKENYEDKIEEAKVLCLKKNMDREDITKIFEEEVVKIKKLTIEVPEDRVKEFRAMYKKWLDTGAGEN